MESEVSTLLSKRLDDLISRRVLVEVYRDRLDDEPLVGRLVQKSAHVFVIEKLDDLYRNNGVAVARMGDITRLKSGGRELEAGASLTQPGGFTALPEVALLEISSAITILQRRFGHATLYLERLDSRVCFIGEVGELDDEFLVLKQFGTLKSMDRSELLVRLDEVTRVEAGGNYERQLHALLRSPNG